MLGPHEHELPLGELGVFARTLDLRAAQAIDLGLARAELIEDLQRDIERRRRHGLEDELTHGLVEARAGNDLTATARRSRSRAAGRRSPEAGWPRRRSSARSSGSPQRPQSTSALQQRDAFARRTPSAIGAVAGGVGQERRLIRLELLPREVARVRVGQEDLPLRARQSPIARLAGDRAPSAGACGRTRRPRRTADCGGSQDATVREGGEDDLAGAAPV